MRIGSLKTAAAIAEEHGHGLYLLIGGRELRLTRLTVVDHPKELALCDGRTPDGDLVLVDADQVEAVRIPAAPDGRKAVVRSVPERCSGS